MSSYNEVRKKWSKQRLYDELNEQQSWMIRAHEGRLHLLDNEIKSKEDWLDENHADMERCTAQLHHWATKSDALETDKLIKGYLEEAIKQILENVKK